MTSFVTSLLFLERDVLLKKYLWTPIFLWISIIAILGCNGEKVKAATNPPVSYNVMPELSSNQINKKVGYFDLKIAPNQKEQIKFKINNNDTKKHSYTISINRSATDKNGVIIYNKHNVKPDNDLKCNIEKLVTYPKHISLAPKTSSEVTVNVTGPSKRFDGVLLGGIFIMENNQVSNKTTKKGVTLKNEYSYVLGLQLQNNEKNIQPDLKFVKASEASENGQVYVDAKIDNDVPKVEQKFNVAAKVTPLNSKKVILRSEKENVSMAPDSYFDYPINVNTVTGSKKSNRLRPGKYMVYLNIKDNGSQNIWRLQRKMTISRAQTRRINKKTPVNNNKKLIILIIAILVIIAGLVIWYYRKNRKE